MFSKLASYVWSFLSSSQERRKFNVSPQHHEVMRRILEHTGIYNFMMDNPSLYVGGSMVSYILSRKITSVEDEVKLIETSSSSGLNLPHDIDIYTTNHIESVNKFLQSMNDLVIHSIEGCVINFESKQSKSKTIKLQFITAEADDFYDDVIGNYDCDLVCTGFHPYMNTFHLHSRFQKAWESKAFNCFKHLSSIERSKKLAFRAENWYQSKLTFVGDNFGRQDSYYKHDIPSPLLGKSILNQVSPPKYLQLFYQKYKCIGCKKIDTRLVCFECQKICKEQAQLDGQQKKCLVFGGCNGYGRIVSHLFQAKHFITKRTSRYPDEKNTDEIEFQFGTRMSDLLLNEIDESDVIVFNATKTLDNDESVWNNYLSDFNASLLQDRVHTNIYGYVQLLQEILSHKSQRIKNGLPNKPTVLFYVDANESKFDGKMIDGKHLELNIAKAGVKQIFYTNASYMAKLNMITVCYDPGWLSYHGIPIEQKKSKSQNLIPPWLSSLALIEKSLQELKNFPISLRYKRWISDYDVYQFIYSKLY
jgi:hypothetical protein